jgi:hypothetical protein
MSFVGMSPVLTISSMYISFEFPHVEEYAIYVLAAPCSTGR